MGEGESPYPNFLWKRWDADDPSGQREADALPDRRFFEFCAVPFAGDRFRERDPEPGNDVVYFLPPRVRVLLRNVPTLVLVFLVLVLVEAEVNPNAEGISTLLPAVPVVPFIYLVVAVAGLGLVLLHSEMITRKALLQATFVYGLVGVLLAGSVYGTYRTLVLRETTGAGPHVLYAFPTLLFTLIIGLLAYDLLLKGENLFGKLGRKNIMSGYWSRAERKRRGESGEHTPSRRRLYDEIRDEQLVPKLEAGIGPFRYGHLFAVLVLSQYLLIWSFNGPLGTGLWSSLLLNLIINLVVLVGVFNFLIGIVFLRDVLKGNYTTDDGERLEPTYLPFHPDRQGGYADIGKLATRINVIVILLGGYYVYRAYISGMRTFPPSSDLPFEPLYAGLLGIEQTPALELVFWTVNFLGPVFLYVAVVFVWFYYTFWEVHKQMAKQKKDLLLEVQAGRIDDTVSVEYPPLGNVDDDEVWLALRNAPEWPVNTRRLGGLITANFAPVVLSVITFVPNLLTAWG